jgi:GTP cyclohydrolase I
MEEKVFRVLNTQSQMHLRAAFRAVLTQMGFDTVNDPHVQDTPVRAAHALDELCSGLAIDPLTLLSTTFKDDSQEMISVSGIEYVSLCKHHFLPFYGEAHFAYIPKGRIVGLSKIPRLIEALARRPQTQEELVTSIADTFQKSVAPLGCAVLMRGMHTCMALRGVRQAQARMTTTAVRGVFKDRPEVRQEFMTMVAIQGEK